MNNSLGVLEGLGSNITVNNATGGTLAQYLRVKITGAGVSNVPTVDVAGIGDVGLGFLKQDIPTLKNGLVRLSNGSGTQIAIASAAILVGDNIYGAAAGKVGKIATAAISIGTALEAASGDGVPFRIAVAPNLPVAA